MKQFKQLKEEYEEVPIPPELDEMIRSTIHQAQRERKRKRHFQQLFISVAALFFIFVSSLNISPVFAQSVGALPGMQKFVQLLTIDTFHFDKETYEAVIETPTVDASSRAAQFLNEQFIESNEQLYEQFKQEMKVFEESGGGHLAVSSTVDVLHDDDILFVLKKTNTQIEASSYVTQQFYTVDKALDLVLTLPSLFKDSSYVDLLNDEVKRQIANSERANYFQRNIHIKPDQSFYINEDHQLVLSFNQYEIGAGVLGPVEFTIPTDVVQSILVSDRYIY